MLAPVRDIRDELVDAYRQEVEELYAENELLEQRASSLRLDLIAAHRRCAALERQLVEGGYAPQEATRRKERQEK